MSELVRIVDISKRAGTTGSRVSAWKREYDGFPRPVSFGPSGSPLYYWAEVQEFMERNGLPKPQKGRKIDEFDWEVLYDGRTLARYQRRSRARLFLIVELAEKKTSEALGAAEQVVQKAGLSRVEYDGHVYEIVRRGN